MQHVLCESFRDPAGRAYWDDRRAGLFGERNFFADTFRFHEFAACNLRTANNNDYSGKTGHLHSQSTPLRLVGFLSMQRLREWSSN